MTTTPHDAMFKAAFSKLRHARGLLRELLPARLGQRFTWSTLRLESGIAVGDEDLDEQRMDLVYSVRAERRRVLIYVLAEHQSKVDPWMVFRLLCYLVAIWKGFRAQHPRARKLPAIFPLVVHHSATGWTAPVAFEEMLDADAELLEALGPYVPRFRFLKV
jgi:predicted transposase/invertase (TIGR01784 family)